MGSRFILGVLSLIVIVFLLNYYFMPFSKLEFSSTPKNYNFSIGGNVSQIQFYPNMRYTDKDISYRIIGCPLSKQGDMLEAFKMLDNLTVLNFHPVNSDEEITVTCDERTKFEGNMFIAGEGGPNRTSEIGEYFVIFHGIILLFRESSCPHPNIAIHELLHALGFIHSDNKNNIMYNYTNCDQTIGDEIPKIIEKIYSTPAKPNLVVENASAIISRGSLYLNFSVNNNGLADSKPTTLDIKVDDKIIKEFDLEAFKIGSGIRVSFEKNFVSRNVENIELIINYEYPELSKEDNTLLLELKK